MALSKHKTFLSLSIIIFIIPVIFYACLGLYTRLYTDDYCQIASSVEDGAIQATINLYNNWSPRYTNNLLRGFTAPYTHHVTRWTFLIFVAWMGGAIWSITWPVMRKLVGHNERLTSTLVMSVVLLVVIAIVNSEQAYYWSASTMAHMLGAILVITYCAIFVNVWLFQRSHVLFGVIICVQVFLASGASEAIAVSQIVLLIMASVLLQFTNHRQPQHDMRSILYLALTVSIVGGVLVIFSPGGANRIDVQVDNNDSLIVQAVFGSLRDMRVFLFNQATLTGIFTAYTAGILIGIFVKAGTNQDNAQNRKSTRPVNPLPLWVVLTALLVSLLSIYPIYSYTSDRAIILDRYSYFYALLLIFHGMLTFAWLVILLRIKAIRAMLSLATSGTWSMMTLIVLAGLLLWVSLPVPALRLYGLVNSLLLVFVGLRAILYDVNDYPLAEMLPLYLRRRSPLEHYGILILLIVAGCSFILASYFAITTLGTAEVRSRVLYMPALVTAGGGMLLGLVLGMMIPLNSTSENKKPLLLYLMSGLALFAIFLLPAHHIQDAWHLWPQYQAHAQEWDARDRLLRDAAAAGISVIQVPILTHDVNIELERGSIEQSDWLKTCMARYYGFEEVDLIYPVANH